MDTYELDIIDRATLIGSKTIFIIDILNIFSPFPPLCRWTLTNSIQSTEPPSNYRSPVQKSPTLFERWTAGVEYHFQEFNEPYAPS